MILAARNYEVEPVVGEYGSSTPETFSKDHSHPAES